MDAIITSEYENLLSLKLSLLDSSDFLFDALYEVDGCVGGVWLLSSWFSWNFVCREGFSFTSLIVPED